MRYLVYCGPGIGDIVILSPMVRAIRKNDPKAVIHAFTCSGRNKIAVSRDMLTCQRGIEKMDYYSIREPIHSLLFLAELVCHRYDFGIVTQYTDNQNTSTWPYHIVKMASRKTCGTAHTFHKAVAYDFCVTHKRGELRAETSLRLLSAMGMNTHYDWSREQLLSKEQLGDKLASTGISRDPSMKTVAFVLGAGIIFGVDCKIWPLPNWRVLSNMLTDAHCRVILLGGKKEAEQLAGSGIESEKVLNFVGKCGIAESVALLSACDLAIGADTGLMHCAGALGIPSLSLFGPTSPTEYLPFGGRAQYVTSNQACSPCFGTEAMLRCKDFACMRRITPQMVYDRAMDMLKQ